ncbi:MAG: TraR/DksA C4-type zinc finger protein [Puniceicoccales bacterium]|jgi:RNA polymerase-binding transcription factor DksA|nr:TraR/DksA C4-type zinc finger protein [Puniceicoccales bacterium]
MNKVEEASSNTNILLNVLRNRKKKGNRTLETDIPYFSMNDVRQVLLVRENEQREQENRIKIHNKQKLIEKVLHEKKNAVVSVAGIADILGFDPTRQISIEREKVPNQYEQYYVKLLQLKEALDKNMGVISPEIEFAWGLLKKETDPIGEVRDAVDRIRKGTYGICEITGEKIAEERLKAVPFTRYSLQGQQILEQQMALKKVRQIHALFGDETEDIFGEDYEEEE